MDHSQVRQRTAVAHETSKGQQASAFAFPHSRRLLVSDGWQRCSFLRAFTAVTSILLPSLNPIALANYFPKHTSEPSGVNKNETTVKPCENPGDGR